MEKDKEMEKEDELKKIEAKVELKKNRGRDHFTSLGALREKFKS